MWAKLWNYTLLAEYIYNHNLSSPTGRKEQKPSQIQATREGDPAISYPGLHTYAPASGAKSRI